VTQLEDSKIISLFFERSEQAVEELDRKYGTAVKKTAANILRDRLDVEECVNDTYLRAWNSIPPQKPNPLVSYVCKIARNLAIDRYHASRAEKRNASFDLVLEEMEECIPSDMNVETEYDVKELTAAINRFLSTLNGEDRFLFVRRYWYGDSIEDLATLTKGNANRISVRLFRIREKLKKSLVKEGLLA
jgi:RNA polymerase sigma-70 factor (ECF subfamily)